MNTTENKLIAELRLGLGEIAVAVIKDPVKLACCRLIDEQLAALPATTEPAPITAPSMDAPSDSDREALTDLIAEHLSGTYHCLRVWAAWNVGTMSQDDFEDVGESDLPAEVAAAILARFATPQLVERKAQPVSDNGAAEASWAIEKVSTGGYRQLPKRLQDSLAALRSKAPADVYASHEHEVDGCFSALHTSLATVRRMYAAARDRYEALEAAALSASQAHGKSEAVASAKEVPLVGTLAALPAHTRKCVEAYGDARVAVALRAQRPAPAAEAAVVAWNPASPLRLVGAIQAVKANLKDGNCEGASLALREAERWVSAVFSTPAASTDPVLAVQPVELLAYIDKMLTNLQPHIEQACYPGKAAFIDNYIDPVIERVRAALASAPSPHASVGAVPVGNLDAQYAARYRWLRTYPNNIGAAVYAPTFDPLCGGLLRRDVYLDAAIDAAKALQAEAKEGGE